jgi:hypothetical protein
MFRTHQCPKGGEEVSNSDLIIKSHEGFFEDCSQRMEPGFAWPDEV